MNYYLYDSNNSCSYYHRATEHPKCPESQDHVRVYDYASQMVIKPHRTFNEVCGKCLNNYPWLLLICYLPKYIIHAKLESLVWVRNMKTHVLKLSQSKYMILFAREFKLTRKWITWSPDHEQSIKMFQAWFLLVSELESKSESQVP